VEECFFAVFQGTSNGGQRTSNVKTEVNRWSDLPYNGTIWRFGSLLLKDWQPPLEVPLRSMPLPSAFISHGSAWAVLVKTLSTVNAMM
jgi:hypothetical protein